MEQLYQKSERNQFKFQTSPSPGSGKARNPGNIKLKTLKFDCR